MFNTLRLLATTESSGPAIHITPGELFTIGDVAVTNAMVWGVVSSIFILIALIVTAKGMTVRPKRGFTQFVEIGTEFIISTIQGALGSRKKAIKYAPFFVTAFFFVMFSNWLGLIPGGGETFVYNDQPLVRPFTSDLNGTLAASIVMMFLVQYFAVKDLGF